MSKRVEGFEDLIAWQRAMDLAQEILMLTETGTIARRFSFRDQIERAASSVPSNIAEGFERGSRAEFHRFLSIAKASCAELRTRLMLASRVGFLDPQIVEGTLQRAEAVSRIVGKLRSSVAAQRDTPRKPHAPSLMPHP